MNIEERLREKSRIIQKFQQSCDTNDPNYTPIRFIELTDAIEITKDLFTKEQVEELLKKQREICADMYYNPRKETLEKWGISNTSEHLKKINDLRDEFINAPSPSLEGEKNG